MDLAVTGRLSEEQEQALFGGLSDVSVEVANRYDQWVRSGSSDAKSAAIALGDPLLVQLERLHQFHQGRIDSAQNAIIAQDGDPEVLYEQKPWQLDRGFALAAAGQLSWLHYRLAMLHGDQKENRQVWLKKSVKEFSEFVYAQDRKMSEESLLGRAMAETELGERDQAAGDLKVILDRGKESPLYWTARLALAQVKAGAGNADALSETQKLLGEASAAGLPGDTLNQIRLMRLEALAVAASKGTGESHRQEAIALGRQLSGLGPVWSKRVSDLALAHLKDPRQLLGSSASAEWIAAENLASEEKFKEAAAAYEAIVRSTEAAAREHATDVHHRLGICYFRLGRFADAEREFRAYLSAAPQGPLSGESAYLQFRAAEGVYRDKPSVDTRDRFASAVENFVTRYPKHENFYEGAFRWAEVLQGQRRFLEAADNFAKVKGTPAFEIRSASSELQCLSDAINSPPEGMGKEWADPLRNRAEEVYKRFERLTAAERSATPELRARATLSRAMAQSGGPAPRLANSLTTLADFEKRFPSLPELHPLASALRLAVASGLHRYDDAARGLDSLPPQANNPGFSDLLERIARSFLRTAADVSETDPAGGQRWAALAAKIFDRLKAEGRAVPAEVKSHLAQVYNEQGRVEEAAALYRELLKEQPRSKSLLRNAAMISDRRKAPKESAEYWARLAMLEEVATASWYDVRLSTAKALLAAGQADKACQSVEEVNGFRPDLRDGPTKKRFEEVAGQACQQKR